MPIRYTSPSLGGHRQVLLQPGEWELGVSYRRLTADDWFVGSDIQPSAAPGGQPNRFNINTVEASVTRGLTDQLSLRLTVPFTSGSNSRIHPDGARHETSSTGVGDISVLGSYWLRHPFAHRGGNVALSLGVKAPTGRHDAEDEFGLPAGGGVIQHAVHPGIQAGDGGWGFLIQAQMYQRLVDQLSVYALGAYQLSPKDTTSVLFTPTSPTSFLSVPDVYHVRLGLAYVVLPQRGLSTSLGVRVDGIPVRDVIGREDGYRSPGYTWYLDPGLAITSGRSTFNASVPVRLRGKFKPSVRDLEGGAPPPGDRGDLASYLIFFGYAYRL